MPIIDMNPARKLGRRNKNGWEATSQKIMVEKI